MQDIMYALSQILILEFYLSPNIRGCKISLARCGGVTHWALTPDDDDSTMTVAWGQNAANGTVPPLLFLPHMTTYERVGELGLGPDEPKSATKPTKSVPLSGIEVFE
jgi:hypothetical protein